MGTKIKSVDMAREGFTRRGSVDLETKAARGCLRKVDVDPKSVGFLINTGVYRDRHLVEPAMSSFIQHRIGANEEFDGQTSTFSFDLINGGCGMLSGMMVADGFLQSGLTSHVLVVGGDAEPVPGLSVGYDFSPAAAAVLMAPGGEDEGFMAFKADTQTQYLESFTSRMEWTGEKKKRNWLIFRSQPSYVEECAACAVQSLEAFLTEADLALNDIDLILPSQSPLGLPAAIRQKTGLGDKVVDVTGRYGHVHTAGVGLALEQVMGDGRFGKARHVIFLTVGAGITTTIALYKNR